MPFKCKLIDIKDVKMTSAKFGDMWFAPWLEKFKKSPEYESTHRGKRPPLVVFVPPGVPLCIDNPTSNMGGHGWKVTGEAPNITVSPSIGIHRSDGKPGWMYHGWLKDGVLSDDIDGKTF